MDSINKKQCRMDLLPKELQNLIYSYTVTTFSDFKKLLDLYEKSNKEDKITIGNIFNGITNIKDYEGDVDTIDDFHDLLLNFVYLF